MTGPITILDGGMGKLLERSGAPFRQPEWSALALMDAPGAVLQAHRDFLTSGADVITTNAYAVVPFHLGDDRFAASGHELAALAGLLARRACDEADRDVEVAGSLPPLFGSYEPDKFRPGDAPAMYDLLIDAQSEAVDLWLAETVSSIDEATAILDALDRCGDTKPRWISFTVPDEPMAEVTLRSGESIPEAMRAVDGRAHAVLFNCSPPEQISHAIDLALDSADPALRVGAYANAFESKAEGYAANEVLLDRRADLDPEEYHEICAAWVARGATIIGGCCQMFPEHIEALTPLRG